MKKVIIDTNFFVLISEKNIDIFREIQELVIGEYELVITSKILSELKHIAKTNTNAKFGLNILNTKINSGEIKLIENFQHPDDFILIFIKNNEVIVCTNDSDLRKKVKKMGAKVISLKGNRRLSYI